MSWRYRIAYKDFTHGDGSTERLYGIVEYYQNIEGPGTEAWTEEFMGPHGETIEELRHDLEMMLKDTYRDDEPIQLDGTTAEGAAAEEVSHDTA
jgi:hypothetical protein